MIFEEESSTHPYEMTIDLVHQTVTVPSGEIYSFSIDPYRKECLLYGIDDFDYLLSKKTIKSMQFEQRQRHRFIDTYADRPTDQEEV